MEVLKLGSQGKLVEDLQKYLKIKVDGDFGLYQRQTSQAQAVLSLECIF